MTKGLNENEWTAIKAVVISLILEGGITFVILAVIFKLMDAESARYLLSAIVQSLAALLAIIFAGVAILWSNEAREIQHLDFYRKEFESILFGSQDWKHEEPGKWPLTSLTRELPKMKKMGEINKDFRIEDFLVGCENIKWLFRMRSSQNPYIKKKDPFWNNFNKEFIEPLDLLPLKTMKKEQAEELRKSAVEFFETLLPVTDLYLAYGCNRVSKGYNILFEVASKKINLHIEDSLRVIRLARLARGRLFKSLISLYSITIAGGMVMLSLLKAGICESQATWIAAFPLGFGIGAVALTFVYLANIISGEKE